MTCSFDAGSGRTPAGPGLVPNAVLEATMRLLFTTSNWAGHYFCMIPLGWAAQAAGHEVRVVCAPAQADTIGRAGLVPVPVLESPDMMYMARLNLYAQVAEGRAALPGLPLHPVTGQRVSRLDEFDVAAAQKAFTGEYGDAVRISHLRTREFARAWRPQLVCHDVLAEEGALVADELGVESVYCAPGLFGTVDEELGLDLALRDLVNNMARPGVPAWGRDRITRVIDPSPPSAVPPLGDAVRMPVRYVPYNGPGALPAWTLERRTRPRVCVVWGRSATGIYGPDVPALREAVEGAAALGADVVLTAAPEQVRALGPLPQGVRVLEDFPLHLLLPEADVLVHHGSDNCLMNGAVAGVPQLSLAMASDQIAFSRRLAATGAVVALEGLTARPDALRAALAVLLDDPAPRAAAGRLQAEMALAPAPSEVLRQLTESVAAV
ncbi:nucleotide disphospho-sugar-binding domain-containing protein [Streptomyces sp. NPDC023838]|uniref:nucleotide disphospho-sugar-binding domain-containing protein n=1 Tax=Streptomyces sp. NPDC023838 TaxID=3154325 RepID=UPI00340F6F21